MPEMDLEGLQTSVTGRMQTLLGGSEDDSLSDTMCPQLTYRQRLYGWGGCYLIGTLISVIFLR